VEVAKIRSGAIRYIVCVVCVFVYACLSSPHLTIAGGELVVVVDAEKERIRGLHRAIPERINAADEGA
jgi:hypothetical protein